MRRSRVHCGALLFALFLIAGCGSKGGVPGVPHINPTPTPTPTPNTHVLVVANSSIPDSETLAQTYMSGRHIPTSNLLSVALTPTATTFTMTKTDLQTILFPAVAHAISSLHASGTRIDFVVMMYGVPYLITGGGSLNGYSVDGVISQATGAFPAAGGLGNPYYGSMSAFSSDTYHMVIVTRLDGRSLADVNGLIQNGLGGDGTNPHGEFFFDVDPTKSDGYTVFNTAMQTAQANLAAAGYDAEIDNTTAFVAPPNPLIGYVSWGSNDAHFSLTAYHALTFKPGAVAETAVSTSASNIRTPGGGQSQIADLIHQGVTAVHGDVTEPFLSAIPDPPTVFKALTSGRTTAESLYSGMVIIVWKEIVIGDPLSTPY